MSAIFADTFYFLALFKIHDIAHRTALEFASTNRRSLLTTEWALTEVADACAEPSKRQHLVKHLEVIANSADSAVVEATHELFARGGKLYAERENMDWPRISFVVMQERGVADALTGDRHFEQAGFNPLLRP